MGIIGISVGNEQRQLGEEQNSMFTVGTVTVGLVNC